MTVFLQPRERISGNTVTVLSFETDGSHASVTSVCRSKTRLEKGGDSIKECEFTRWKEIGPSHSLTDDFNGLASVSDDNILRQGTLDVFCFGRQHP